MDAREQRGAIIAATRRLIEKNGAWSVPSQTGHGRYTVKIGAEVSSCTCPDHEAGFTCKHIHACKFTIERTRQEVEVDGSTTTTTESLTLTATVKRQTYRQDWPKYNQGQTQERRYVLKFLNELCQRIPQPEPKNPKKGGRPSIPIGDAIFAACMKVYSLNSARRFNGELEEACEQGFIGRVPHFNSVLNVFDKEETTPILKNMIQMSALPLVPVEKTFAVDSTGFGTCGYIRWIDHKYGGIERKMSKWVKVHFTTGTRTNIVPAVNIDHRDAHDAPQMPSLVKKTAESFEVNELSADKAYGSADNFAAMDVIGGQFFPMFKKNATGAAGGSYEKMFHYFSLHREEYLKHYHQRSNIESTVSMIKRTLGDDVKSKTDLAQKNEVYAKFVCHNLRVVVAEMFQLGISPLFECTNTREPAQILRFPG